MNLPASLPIDLKSEIIRFHGRRKGRPLNTGRQQAIETILPQLRIALPDGALLDPAALQPGKAAYHLEIGFGTGEHLIAQAATHPAIGFIGAEPFVNGYAKLLHDIGERQLSNMRLWPDEMRPLLTALKPQSLDRIYLLFSDPWPKKRHAPRRVLQQDILDLFARVLKTGGELRIATDDPTLQEWTLEQMAPRRDFTGAQHARPDAADWPPTRYEQKAISAGRTPHFYSYKRV